MLMVIPFTFSYWLLEQEDLLHREVPWTCWNSRCATNVREKLLNQEWKKRWDFEVLEILQTALFSEKNESLIISKFTWVDRYPVRLQSTPKTTACIRTALLGFSLRLLSTDLPLHLTVQEPVFETATWVVCLPLLTGQMLYIGDGWTVWLMRVPLNLLKSSSTGKMSFQEYKFCYLRLDPKGKADINRQCSRSSSVSRLCWRPSTHKIYISGYFVFGLASARSHGVNAQQRSWV